MGGGEGAKGNLKNEEAEQGGLEPDPRYIRCCSAVCRPGYALRDALLGLLVLLGLSVVVTVIFVVCFYVIPDEKQLIDEGILPGTAKGVVRGPEDVNEITLREGDKYTLPPHNFDDDDTGGESGVDLHEGLAQDFSTFPPPSGVAQETTDRAQDMQDANPDSQHSQDLQTDPYESEVPEESLQPRENFDIHLHEESNNSSVDPNVVHQDEPENVSEHVHFQRDEDLEHQGSRVQPEETVDYVALTEEEQEGCSPVQLPMCISSVPWTQTGSPNWLNHTSEGEMFAALPYIRSSLLDSGCSTLAPLYACSVLEPPCRDLQVLPPCRAFCEEVAQSCQSFVQSASLPGLFHCSRYPDSADPSVCISAQQECSGADDFRCATTGLCVPSSWLCDGADDCRDNSDELNCPLTPDLDRSPTENIGDDDTDRLATYGDTEYSDSNADRFDIEYRAESHGGGISPLGYPHFDPEDPSTINDPALAGPSLNDPALLEAAYRQENEARENLPSFQSNIPPQEPSEQEFSSAEITGETRQSHEFQIFVPETPMRQRPGRKNISNNEKDGLIQYELVNDSGNIDSISDEHEPDHPDNEDFDSSAKGDDMYTDYSVRNDHFQNHPIPDVDYPAKETFSVDSTSSVDQKYHQISGDKNENEYVPENVDENTFKQEVETDPQFNSNTPDVRTPSQRIRERLSVGNRFRQNPISQVTRRQRPTSTVPAQDKSEFSVPVSTQRPTRPPSRLANFQDRFREWRDKRRPTLPSDLENLSPNRNSATAGTPGTGRPYDLIRRRPQSVTTPSTEPTTGVELLRENVAEGDFPKHDYNDEDFDSSNIRQPITLPKSVIPEPDDLNFEMTDSRRSEEDSVGSRPTRVRPGFRFRQSQRQRTDSNSENQRLPVDDSRIIENYEIRDGIPQQEVLSEQVSRPTPESEFHGQQTYEDTNVDQEPFVPYRPQINHDQEIYEDLDPSNVDEGQEHRRQNYGFNQDDEFYSQEVSDSISNPETYGSLQPEEPHKRAPFDHQTPEIEPEMEQYDQESVPSEPHSQKDDSYSGQSRHEYSNKYFNQDDSAVYSQQSGEEEAYMPPEYRPQKTYEEQNYQVYQPQESIRQSVHNVPQSQSTRHHARRPSSEDNLPSNFRVSFPPPRSVRPYQQAPAISNSFYKREDALVSDLRYDVPGVNEQQYPTYQQPPIRRPDAYASPYARQQLF